MVITLFDEAITKMLSENDEASGTACIMLIKQTEGGFPELKVLKQKIRNHISPDMGLGHSDKAGAHGHGSVTIPIETTASKES